MKKGLLCILVLLIGCTLSGCSNENQKVNVNDYAKIKPIGYDGYGKIDFEIDYESMFNNSSASTHQKETALRIAKEYDLYTIKSNDF